MKLNKYDQKLVRITSTDNVYEGYALYNSSEYNEHEYGVNEDSLELLDILFYKSYIKKVEEIDSFSDDYGPLEELILDSGVDFIEEELESEYDIHTIRLLRCIKDKYENKKDLKDILNKLLERTHNKEIVYLINDIINCMEE